MPAIHASLTTTLWQYSTLSDRARRVKRLADLFIGVILAIVTIPLVAAAAVLIFLEDGRPIIFRQARIGEGGRLFLMYKLRTMKTESQLLELQSGAGGVGEAPPEKRRDDPRVTHIGRLLRRFSIDELPQLVNVLRGQMSLVGPRPELPEWVETYELWQHERFSVPAGITGWWQVTGRGDKVMHLHTQDDIFYARNWSFGLDIRILVRTLWVVLMGHGAF